MERAITTASRPYANRRERRREETRQRLIEAALALMHEKPFDQVTVEEITELADVAKGTFFTYFPTKEHLLHAYIRDMTDEVYEFLDSLQPENAPSQWEVLRQVMLFIAQREGRSIQIARSMMVACCHSSVLREQMLEITKEATERARTGFEAGQRTGEFRTDVSAEELAHQAIRLYRLCQMEWMMERPDQPLEQIVERVLEFYKPAFLASSGTGVPPVSEPSALERDAQATPRSTGVPPVQPPASPMLERDAQATLRGTGVPPVSEPSALERDAPATLRGTGVPPVSEPSALERDAPATRRSTSVSPVQPPTPATLERDAPATMLGQDVQATYLDPTRAIAKRLGAYLPHWRQDGATYFVTFRLADSLPQAALKAIRAERDQLRREYQAKGALTPAQEARLKQLYSDRIEQYLDAGYGACWLQRDEIAQIVADALQHFDGVRYHLWAWCIMPNHVHVVVQPLGEWELSQIIKGWKGYTARRANQLLGRRDTFWQAEYFDHIIRNAHELERIILYTLLNPEQAGLQEWRWRGGIASSSTDTPVRAPKPAGLGQECPSHIRSTDTPVRAPKPAGLGQECPSHIRGTDSPVRAPKPAGLGQECPSHIRGTDSPVRAQIGAPRLDMNVQATEEPHLEDTPCG